MTTETQKQTEERYARMFLDGQLAYTAIDGGEEPPDVWVRRAPEPDIALEITEYHPPARGAPDVPRKAVESRWWDGLEPLIDKERRAKPALEHVSVHLGFSDPKLPRQSQHAVLAVELVRLVEHVAEQWSPADNELDVEFVARDGLARMPTRWPGALFLPSEDWPQASKELCFLKVSIQPGVPYRPWLCQNATTAWLGPDVAELKRILEGKAEKTRGCNSGGAPLWLLVVCESQGDLQSHIFPGIDQLAYALKETHFDFAASPFDEVWFLSVFGGHRLRVYPGTASEAG